jgi:flagellar basal-body rod modification protein FlgD
MDLKETIPMDPISSVNTNGLANQAKPRKSELDMATFIQLLSAQLSNQNPLEPMNDRDFFAQMAQLGTVQGMAKLEDAAQVQQAASLLGKTVTAFRPMTESGSGANELFTGRAVGLNVKHGENWLVLEDAKGGQVEVQMSSIQSVSLGSTP